MIFTAYFFTLSFLRTNRIGVGFFLRFFVRLVYMIYIVFNLVDKIEQHS